MRVVAVFGGGGAKSLAHAGAWKALGEAGLTPSNIVGTSMGAVIGAAFAAGSSYDALFGTAGSLAKKDFAALDVWSLAKGVFAGNILKPEPLKHTIARLVPAARFADLKIPLTITTTDLDSGQLVLFGALGQDAPLVDALYASCALPLYFPPQVLDGRRLADGGLRAVLPLAVARRIPADLVVAIDVGPGFDEPPADRKAAVPALVRAHGEAIRVMMAAQTERAIAEWPKDGPRLVVVRAVAEREATFAVGASERYLKAGYEETQRALRVHARS
ncbi:MAG TPA: patatin-like phospholipase family protein [Gemmatimonadales bacterium]|nr:patatin-like phospholipase family protein [Gemmatimonadales bacterium]